MAWFLGASREGYALLVLPQAIGGILAIGATIALARQSGLGRGPALLAGGLLLGMANVAAQFTAAQTDLFTTGVFAAAFALWLAAVRRGNPDPRPAAEQGHCKAVVGYHRGRGGGRRLDHV
jgi:hypothetical protein